jgi:hypothetical protein
VCVCVETVYQCNVISMDSKLIDFN